MPENTPPLARQLFDMDTFADLCSISIHTVKKYVKAGKLASVTIGTRRLIPRYELQRVVLYGLDGGNGNATGD